MEIIDSARISLDKALRFYESHGIFLSYVPTIRFFDEFCDQEPGVCAASNTSSGFDSYFNRMINKKVWENFYKLSVSQEAYDEFDKVMDSRVKENVKEYGGADIFLFRPFVFLDKIDSDIIMSHELWHLVEEDKGIIHNNIPFLCEGTAHLASSLSAGRKFFKKVGECNDYFELLYDGCASIVQEKIKCFNNPFLAMLEPGVRDSIQEEILESFVPRLYYLIEKNVDEEDCKEGTIIILSENTRTLIPEVKDLEWDYTPEKIIGLYERIGCVKLAGELRGQDLSLLIEYNFDESDKFDF